MAGGGVLDLRRIEAGDDLHHAGDLLRLREVERFHQPVGDRAAHDLGDQAVRGAQIVGVFGPAGHFLVCVHAGDALSDSHMTSLLANKLEGSIYNGKPRSAAGCSLVISNTIPPRKKQNRSSGDKQGAFASRPRREAKARDGGDQPVVMNAKRSTKRMTRTTVKGLISLYLPESSLMST